MIADRLSLRLLLSLALVLLLPLAIACGGGTEEAATRRPRRSRRRVARRSRRRGDIVATGEGEPRIFFVEPQDGDEVTSPVKLVFGAENSSSSSPASRGEVNPGAGHHHVARSTCPLPAARRDHPERRALGALRRDGSSEIEVQAPTQSRRASPLDPDRRRRSPAPWTEPGLCQAMINITVVESEEGLSAPPAAARGRGRDECRRRSTHRRSSDGASSPARSRRHRDRSSRTSAVGRAGSSHSTASGATTSSSAGRASTWRPTGTGSKRGSVVVATARRSSRRWASPPSYAMGRLHPGARPEPRHRGRSSRDSAAAPTS